MAEIGQLVIGRCEGPHHPGFTTCCVENCDEPAVRYAPRFNEALCEAHKIPEQQGSRQWEKLHGRRSPDQRNGRAGQQ